MTRVMSLVTHISVSLHFHPEVLYTDISISSFYYFDPTRPNHPGVPYTDISVLSFYYFIKPVPIILEYYIQIYPSHPFIILPNPSQSFWSTIYRYIRLILLLFYPTRPNHSGVPYTDISVSSFYYFINPSQSSWSTIYRYIRLILLLFYPT